MISIPLFVVAVCWLGADGGAVDHLDVAMAGGGDGIHHTIPDDRLWASREAFLAGRSRAIGQIAHPGRSAQNIPFCTPRIIEIEATLTPPPRLV